MRQVDCGLAELALNVDEFSCDLAIHLQRIDSRTEARSILRGPRSRKESCHGRCLNRGSKVLIAITLFAIPASLTQAGSPQVAFDVAAIVECRDVTTPEFAKLHRNERLIEARLQISALVSGAPANKLTEFFYRIDSPERSMQVVDYLPRTTLASDFASNVGIEEKKEQSTAVGLNAAGPYGPLTATNANLSASDKNANCLKYELLPPLETVAASGTLDRGNGVYFKLRPTPRNSVEGAKEIIVVLRTPSTWRADYVTVRCQALGQPSHVPFSSRETQICGQGSFVVALYLASDEDAQAAARDFILAESELRQVAGAERDEVERRAAPTPVHELAVQLAVKQPRIPADWLEQLLVGPQRDAVRFLGYLPAPVRESAMDYSAARRKLRAVNEPPSRLPQVAGTLP